MQNIIKSIPNCITALNLAAGTLAIISATHSIHPYWGLLGFQWAFIFIAIAAVADYLDGFVARIIRGYSELGKELDSLCDLVSFGLAPALIIFFLLQDLYWDETWIRWTVILIPICAAFRLSRFNIDSRQTTVFIGLPVPANAIFWIGYSSLIYDGVDFLAKWYVFIPFLIVVCWLMNSQVRMFSLKMHNLSIKENLPRYLIIGAAALFCFVLGVSGLFWLIVFYLLCSLAFKPKI